MELGRDEPMRESHATSAWPSSWESEKLLHTGLAAAAPAYHGQCRAGDCPRSTAPATRRAQPMATRRQTLSQAAYQRILLVLISVQPPSAR